MDMLYTIGISQLVQLKHILDLRANDCLWSMYTCVVSMETTELFSKDADKTDKQIIKSVQHHTSNGSSLCKLVLYLFPGTVFIEYQ